jgi:site-specific DNA recombinase
MKQKQGIIYVRVSSGEQVAGTSLATQEKMCRDFCAQRDIIVAKVFKDEGASAKSSEREEFLKAIEYSRKKNIDLFIVYKVDRFARNTEDHFLVRGQLAKYGTHLLSVTEPIGDDPTGKLFETMLAGFADFDNAIRKQRCSGGMSAKIDEGIYPWKAPIGYMPNENRSAEYARKEKKSLPDQPHPELAPILQETLKEFAKGFHTKKSFKEALERRGFGTLRGKETTASFVDIILEERRLKWYAGELYNPFTHETVQGLHEPIITYEEALEIIDVLHGKKRAQKKGGVLSPLFPLRSGTALCSQCGKPLTGSSPRGNGGTYHYYHCFNAECPLKGKNFSKEIVESHFLDLLKEITPSEEFVRLFKEAVLDKIGENERRNKEQKEVYEKKVRALEQKRERIFSMYEEGAYTPEDFKERKAKIENELTVCSISAHEAHIDELDANMVLTQAEQFITSLSDYWSRLDVNVKPRFQKYLFPNGITYFPNRGFRTDDLALTFRLNQDFMKHNSTLVDLTGLEPATS